MKLAILIVLAIAVILLVIALIQAPRFAAQAILVPRRLTPDYVRTREALYHKLFFLTPKEIGLDYEEMKVTTRDSIPLAGWFIPSAESGGKTLVIVHGIGDSRISWIPSAKEFHDRKFNVFLFDMRAHGISGGAYCTYGAKEKFDLSSILDYLLSRKDVSSVALLGNSLGAATAIQCGEIDPRVKALVAQSPFRNLHQTIEDYSERSIPWVRLLILQRTYRRVEKLAGFRINDVRPETSIRNVHCPVLFIDGMKDESIPATYTEYLYGQANDPKEIWEIPGAGHDTIISLSGTEYYGRIAAFLRHYL